jgi:hypothetical protein
MPRAPARARIWLIAALLLVATSLPLVYGTLATPAGKVFLWTTRLNAADQSAYLAWMEQGRAGHVLFDNPFTHEPHARRLFMPLFLFTGLLARLMGTSAGVAWLGVRVALVFLLPFVLARWLRESGTPERERGLALAMMLVSSGLGWALEPFGVASADVGIPEAITLASAYQRPLFVASLILLLIALAPSFDKAPPAPRRVVLSAAAAFLLAWLHPYDAVTLALVAGLALMLPSVRRGRIGVVAVPIAAAAALAVQYTILRSEPVFEAWTRSVPARSPSPLGYVFGYGLLVPLAAAGALSLRRGDRDRLAKLALWIGVTACLVYAPVSYQRRFIHGVHVPICMLAAAGWLRLLERARLPQRARPWATLLLLLAAMPTNLVVAARDTKGYGTGVAPFYIRREYMDAFEWLRHNTPPEATVLSILPSGNFIAPYSGNRVFLGHSDLTLLARQKEALATAFFRSNDEDDQKRALLAQAGIRYVYHSDLEQSLGSYRPAEKDYLALAYENPRVRIYAVRPS